MQQGPSFPSPTTLRALEGLYFPWSWGWGVASQQTLALHPVISSEIIHDLPLANLVESQDWGWNYCGGQRGMI